MKNNTDEVVDECLCLHAEENALLEAGRDRIGDDAVIYCNTYVHFILLPAFLTFWDPRIPECQEVEGTQAARRGSCLR